MQTFSQLKPFLNYGFPTLAHIGEKELVVLLLKDCLIFLNKTKTKPKKPSLNPLINTL